MTAMQATQRSAAEQRAFYEDQGYLVYPELLSQAELVELRAALAEVLRQAEGLTESNEKFIVRRGDDGRDQVTRINDVIALHKAFYDLVFHPKILDAVENLIGPNIQLHHTKVNLKPPSTKWAAYPWHQDYAFAPHTNLDLLAVMIHLDDSTEDNGCLRIIPGSHKLGPLSHGYGRFYGLENERVLEDSSRWLSMPLPAGGMELHHCCLLHSSTANRGTSPRSAILFQYRAADNLQLAGSTRHYGYGMQVRGENPHVVRMIEGVFQLPAQAAPPAPRGE